MCGGGDPIQQISDTLASVDPGPAIGQVGASIDSAVNNNIPGGWATVGSAALMAAGIYDPTLLSMADSGTLTDAAISNAGFDPTAIAQQVDPYAGLSANAPVDTALSQAAAASTPAVDTTANAVYDASTPGFVGPSGTPDVAAADAAAQANQSALSQSGNILGNTVDENGNIIQTFDDGSTITTDPSGNVISTTDAIEPAGGLPSSVTNAAQSLAKQAASKLLSSAASKLATGTGIAKTALTPAMYTRGYNPNISGSTVGGDSYTAPNLTADLVKGNTNFSLLGEPTAAAPQLYSTPTNFAAYTPSAPVQSSSQTSIPTFSTGGDVDEHNATFFSPGGLASMDNTYVQGDGDGTSDSVKAMLADGEFVIPADVVSGLGNGSNRAGAKVLDQFLTEVRSDKQSNNPDELPPNSKGALSYLEKAQKKVRA